jgi:K+-sensing histidine kinase KdpD
MESLLCGLDGTASTEDASRAGARAGGTLKGALEQVVRMSRDVETLVELAAPKPVAPLRCTVEEILQAALAMLPVEQRARVRVARPAPAHVLLVDGPLLSGSLGHLLESALDAADRDEWVLLQVRHEVDATLFAIVEGGSSSILQPGDLCRGSLFEAHLGLGISLAVRDLDRMGVELEIDSTTRGCTRVLVQIPDAGTGGPA